MDNKTFIQMGYAGSVGVGMVLLVFVSLYFGHWLDKKFGTLPYFTIIFLLIGVFVGFRNVYHFIVRNFKNEEPIIKSLKRESHRKRPAPAKA
jgi:ATP synthase protein I